jgi:KDO2-lipid IV(A) lauroyltransferase
MVKYLIEAAAVIFLFAIFKVLPLDLASAIGSFLGRTIGPFLSAQKIADNNLSMIFPDLSQPEKNKILRDMWDNLGRNAVELPHLPGKQLFNRMTVKGIENLPPPGQAAIFFSGHFGNWELTYPIAHRNGLTVTLIYRSANNPYVDNIVAAIRATQSTNMLPKGPQGGIKLARAIKQGSTLAMLVDQKMNEGIAVPFFGRDAMTAPAIAEFALRYNMPLIPARAIRTKGCHFEATVYPPLQYEKTGDHEKDVLNIMTKINATLEGWIREYPSQWFWVHRRWPKA